MRAARRRQADREKAARRAARPDATRLRANEKPPTCSAPPWLFVRAGLSIRSRLDEWRYTFTHRGRRHLDDSRTAECLLADYEQSQNPHPSSGDPHESAA
jgi:hypothetical protein